MAETESPIEDMFLRAISKRLDTETCRITPQFPAETICGSYRLDFVIDDGRSRIGIECDGEEFHDNQNWRDEWRDAMILGDKKVDRIYRFRGKDLKHHPDDVLGVLAWFHPRIFDDRQRWIVERAASEHIPLHLGETFIHPEQEDLLLGIGGEPERPNHSMWFLRRFMHKRRRNYRQWIRELHDFALATGIDSLAELRAQFFWKGPNGERHAALERLRATQDLVNSV